MNVSVNHDKVYYPEYTKNPSISIAKINKNNPIKKWAKG